MPSGTRYASENGVRGVGIGADDRDQYQQDKRKDLMRLRSVLFGDEHKDTAPYIR